MHGCRGGAPGRATVLQMSVPAHTRAWWLTVVTALTAVAACASRDPSIAPHTEAGAADLLAEARDFELGHGVPRDYRAAARIYRKGCRRGAGQSRRVQEARPGHRRAPRHHRASRHAARGRGLRSWLAARVRRRRDRHPHAARPGAAEARATPATPTRRRWRRCCRTRDFSGSTGRHAQEMALQHKACSAGSLDARGRRRRRAPRLPGSSAAAARCIAARSTTSWPRAWARASRSDRRSRAPARTRWRCSAASRARATTATPMPATTCPAG